jgi:hypothetical protein
VLNISLAMRPTVTRRMSPSALFLLAAFAIIAISRAAAQDLPTLTVSTNNAIPTASGPTTDSASSAEPTQTTSESQSDSQSDTATEDTASNTLPALTSFTGSSVETTGTPPSLSTTSDSVGLPRLTDLPTLSGAYNYPAPSVPPTSKAPYMQHSNLPEGTVFIAVGSALGFFAAVIIAWRGLVAWSINRSVRRSATKGYSAVGESSYDKSDRRKSGLYSSVAPAGSTISLEKLVPTNRVGTAGSNAPQDNTNLFFSPTLGAGMHTPGSRNSGYLPSGYYASTTAAPGGGTGMTTLGGPGDRGSKLRPHSGVYSSPRHLDPSPPDSPDVRPSTAGLSTAGSRSSLNLSTTTANRAPSTYLDDLMSAPPIPQHGHVSGRPKRESMGRTQYRD